MIQKGIMVTIRYDSELQQITGIDEERAHLSCNSMFSWLLECILMEYPEMEEAYSPEELLFYVNGYVPKPYSPLFDGDEIYFRVV